MDTKKESTEMCMETWQIVHNEAVAIQHKTTTTTTTEEEDDEAANGCVARIGLKYETNDCSRHD